jgi:glycosyltransferase involved in cell wall biosynthesis
LIRQARLAALLRVIDEHGGQRAMNNPLISVAVLIYNHEKLLPRTLESFRDQSFKDYELILVDNKSPDKSLDVIDRFKAANPDMDIVIVANESRKPADGRRAGYENAAGRYIMFHDGDDWLEKDCLEKFAAALDDNDFPDCVICDTKTIDDRGVVYDISPRQSIWFCNTLQGVLWDRKVIEACSSPFLDTYFEDFYVSASLKTAVHDSIRISEPLYCYYVNTNSASTMMKKSDHSKIVAACEELYGYLARSLGELSGKPAYFTYEYQFIAHYYSCIFAYCIDYSFKNKIRVYKALNSTIKKYMPDYLKNESIAFSRDNGDITPFKRNIWLSARLEKADAFMGNHFLMNTLLLVYHICYKMGIYKAKR